MIKFILLTLFLSASALASAETKYSGHYDAGSADYSIIESSDTVKCIVDSSYLKRLQRKVFEAGGIRFEWNFEGGSLDSVAVTQPDTLFTCLDSNFVKGKMIKDSVIVISRDTILIEGKRFEAMAYKQALPDSLMNYLSLNIISRFDPLNPADTLLKPSGRWYYFKMSGVKEKPLILNIYNSEAKRPFYSYDNVNFHRFSKEEAPDSKRVIKKFNQESVYIAYFIPYTNERLQFKIDEWSKKPFVTLSSIGKTTEGREMPMLTVSENKNSEEEEKLKVYIHGRIHTSEAPASWHLEKMIDIITDTTDYSKALRKRIEFYILPFANPDGVANGLSRSNLQGINLEVDHAMPDSLTAPEVKNIRAFLLEKATEAGPFDLFLNMHSQISDFVTYWIHTKKSTSESFFANLMKLCNLTTDKNNYFGRENYCYSSMNSKYLEGWFWDNYKDSTLAITFETPYSFYNYTPDSTAVTIENLQELAANNVRAIGDYFQVSSNERLFLNEEMEDSNSIRVNDNKYLFFGKSFIKAKIAGAKVKYRSRRVNKGEYDLYIWKVGKATETENNELNSWIQVDSIVQENKGKFLYIYECKNKGEMVDNMMLIKKK